MNQMEELQVDFAKISELVDPTIAKMLRAISRPMPINEFEYNVDLLQDFLLKNGDKEFPVDYTHSFADGTYYRQMIKPPMYLSIGQRHKYDHQCIMLYGAQVLFTHEGVCLVTGPVQFLGKAGGRKVFLTLTEVGFANVFANPDDCRDISELESRYVTEDSRSLVEERRTRYLMDDIPKQERILQLRESGMLGEGHTFARREAMTIHAIKTTNIVDDAKYILGLSGDRFSSEFDRLFPIPSAASDYEGFDEDMRKLWATGIIKISEEMEDIK